MCPELIIVSPSYVENFSESQFVILCKLIKRTIQVDTVEFRLKNSPSWLRQQSTAIWTINESILCDLQYYLCGVIAEKTAFEVDFFKPRYHQTAFSKKL